MVGCHGEAEQAQRAEAARIAHAVDALRDAPNAAKAPRLKALEQMPCSVPDVCELQRVCVDAYRRQVHALDGVSAVRDELAGDAGPQAAASAAALLGASRKELSAAHTGARHCADLQGSAVRKYKL